jgi:hypothetical protein
VFAKHIRYIVTNPSTVEELKNRSHDAELQVTATEVLDELSVRRGDQPKTEAFSFTVIDTHYSPYFLVVQDGETLKTTVINVDTELDEISFTLVVSNDN